MGEQPAELRDAVRQRYAAAATGHENTTEGCCGPAPAEVDHSLGSSLYTASEREQLPIAAVAASLGCGNPIAVAGLREGERVLDLGSGGGVDVLLSARRVGPTGKAYGLDMTEEMLALALSSTKKAGATNVEFLKGTIENIPLPANTIDVVISNCVINLSVDKPAVFNETFRVLTPGGRIGITDVVAEDHLSPQARADRGSYVGCIAGALTFAEYHEQLRAAGFTEVEITPTRQVTDHMHSAIIRATKPGISETGDACCGVTACCTSTERATDPRTTITEATDAAACGCHNSR